MVLVLLLVVLPLLEQEERQQELVLGLPPGLEVVQSELVLEEAQAREQQLPVVVAVQEPVLEPVRELVARRQVGRVLPLVLVLGRELEQHLRVD